MQLLSSASVCLDMLPFLKASKEVLRVNDHSNTNHQSTTNVLSKFKVIQHHKARLKALISASIPP